MAVRQRPRGGSQARTLCSPGAWDRPARHKKNPLHLRLLRGGRGHGPSRPPPFASFRVSASCRHPPWIEQLLTLLYSTLLLSNNTHPHPHTQMHTHTCTHMHTYIHTRNTTHLHKTMVPSPSPISALSLYITYYKPFPRPGTRARDAGPSN